METLKDLTDDELKEFKWYLKQPDILEGNKPIKVSELENVDRRDIVDLMVNTCGLDGALKVTKKVLEKIPRNDLVQSLSEISSGPEGQSHFFFFNLYFQIKKVGHSICKRKSFVITDLRKGLKQYSTP